MATGWIRELGKRGERPGKWARGIAAFSLGVFLILLLGASSHTSPRRFKEEINGTAYLFNVAYNDGTPVYSANGTIEGDLQARFEGWSSDPDRLLDFETPNMKHTRVLQTTTPTHYTYATSPSGQGRKYMYANWGFDPSPPHMFSYDIGLCGVTIPWDAGDLESHLSQLVGPYIPNGLAGLIVDSFNAAAVDATETRSNIFWMADYTQGVYFNTGNPTQLIFDPGTDEVGAPDHRMCMRAYFHTDGRLKWLGGGTVGNYFGYLFGFGILFDLFNIGSCPRDRLGAMTVCGQFDVTRPGDIVVEQIEGIDPAPVFLDAPPGALTFRVQDVAVRINDWPQIKVGCNNQKPTMEQSIEDAVRETVGLSIGQLASSFTENLPFGIERTYLMREGLRVVVAESPDDPDYVGANLLGLCAPSARHYSGYLDAFIYEDTP